MRDYREITRPSHFRPAPLDWFVVITDVVDSSAAIHRGAYKEVNLAGAMAIVAMANAAEGADLASVFGGDGATFLIPGSMLGMARRVLAATRARAQEAFGLVLRVGIVPVRTVVEAGYAIRVGKLRISEQVVQAVFTGDGLAHAERLIKHPGSAPAFALPAEVPGADADFSGLECRWQPIPTEKDEIVSLLVEALGDSEATRNQIYREVLLRLEGTFGRRESYHPINPRLMRLATRVHALMSELRAKHAHASQLIRLFRLGWMRAEAAVGTLLFKHRLRFQGVDWGLYHDQLVQNTDYRKFDGMVRMVLSAHTEARIEFQDYLETQQKRGRLRFGLHVADHALLTCLVLDRHKRHLHFVDGAEGGYALAAKALKAQAVARPEVRR